ncbi:DUF1564 domain-containing protein [Leptospira sp. WS92.C1]
MGILLLNENQTIQSRLQGNKTTVVTLLISEHTLLRYSEKEKKTLPKRIPNLLKRYGKFLTSTRRLGDKAETILYQRSPGERKMRKINARIGMGSWVLLGALAQAHGVSRCFLFNYLLYLEEVELGNSIVHTMNEGAPTFHRDYRYILHLDLLNNRITRELKCDPRDTFYVLDYRNWFHH